MKHPVVHFEVVGRDKDVLYGFYKDLFEWDVQDTQIPGGAYGLVQGGEGEIGGGIGAVSDVEGYVTFYVQVDDVEEALGKAEALGASRVMGPTEPVPGTTIGLFTDPEGHLIGLTAGGGS